MSVQETLAIENFNKVLKSEEEQKPIFVALQKMTTIKSPVEIVNIAKKAREEAPWVEWNSV